MTENERLREALLPCPFCGGPAKGRTVYHGMPLEPTVQIRCTVCRCGTEEIYAEAATAIAAWNRRAALASTPPGAEGTQAARDVLAERKRQVEVEGWTVHHDDEHSSGEMARAASAYAYEAGRTDHQRMIDARIYAAGEIREDHGPFPPAIWPWSREWWRPTTRRRDLVKAGALILAEIERLDRASPPASEG